LKYWKRLGESGEEDLGLGWNSGKPLDTELDQMLDCLHDKLSDPILSSEGRNLLEWSWVGGDPAVVSSTSWKLESSSRVTLEGALQLKNLPEPPVIFLPFTGFKVTSSAELELEYKS